ncbi:MAG TPA: hypothetical protein VGG05_26075 [Pseudonocardiaceae bacterium]|jgi:hypothetical protein
MSSSRWTRTLAGHTRRVGWGRSTLRRATDRIEAATVLAALALAVAAVPLATHVGTATYHHDLAVSAEQTAASRPAVATLLRNAPVATGDQPILAVSVPATWTYPPGHRHTGTVTAPEGAVAGSRVAVRITPTGTAIVEPMTRYQAWNHGGMMTMATLVGILAGLATLVLLIHRRLDRARYAAWDAEWRQVAPRWAQPTN